MTHKMNLENAETEKIKKEHLKPVQSADALFHFMTKYQFLESTLKSKMISLRYCKEDFKFLKIQGLKELAFPMRCFCDINFHMLSNHIDWYGNYAIAFSKKFGIDKGIQPVTYVNSESEWAKDFGESFSAALQSEKTDDIVVRKSKNYLLHQLMYIKPIQGSAYNYHNKQNEEKCLMDESEWRYIADVTMLGMKQVIKDVPELMTPVLARESNALEGHERCSLTFDYNDIKYIVLVNDDDFIKLSKMIEDLNLEFEESSKLLSKVIVWEQCKGDF